MTSIKRLNSELLELKKNIPYGCSIGIENDNLFLWNAIIINLNSQSPYYRGVFRIKIYFNDEYPYKCPKIEFLTNIFHPNIYNKDICLDILKDSWSPAMTIEKLLISILSLLDDPNPDDPLDTFSANLFKSNYADFFYIARNNVLKYAKGDN